MLTYNWIKKKSNMEVMPIFKMAGILDKGISWITDKSMFTMTLTNVGFNYFTNLNVYWRGGDGVVVDDVVILDEPRKTGVIGSYGEIMICLDITENYSDGYLEIEGYNIYGNKFKYTTGILVFERGVLTRSSQLENINRYL